MADKTESDGHWRVPVIEESLQVGKRWTDTGRGVRIHKTVSEETWRVDETLMQQALEMRRVPINAWLATDALPVQRQEGATWVIPVLEEVLVVEKRVRLKEEIRITVKTTTHPASERVVLRKEQVDTERFDAHVDDSNSSLKGERND